jgi:predicted AlkP superfamily pyrophosphatase or phosphodiesterase
MRQSVVLALILMLNSGGVSAGTAGTRVIVFGVDGLSPAGIEQANTPNIHSMMKAGAWTFHARAVFPTVSSPNWAAMIMGAPVEMTGVISNEWQPDQQAIPPVCQTAPGIFPTIFGLMHQQHPDEKTAIFTDWKDFVRLVEPGVVTKVFTTDELAEPAFEAAMQYLREASPTFLFIHLDNVDNAGHSSGWQSRQYLDAVEADDRLLGELFHVLDETGMRQTTTVLLTADHGGLGKKHGGMTMVETEVPWIASGPEIPKDFQIAAPVMQYDTAATLATLLETRPSPCWRGKSVLPVATTKF